MRWEVGNQDVDDVRLRHRLERLMATPSSVVDRLGEPPGRADLPPRVGFVADASESASVLEVRAADHRGLVSRVCRVITDCGADVRSAHIETLGHQAADVFYLVGDDGGRLPSELEAVLVRRLVEVLA
jgi:[protein-PII] uridylyltransferase